MMKKMTRSRKDAPVDNMQFTSYVFNFFSQMAQPFLLRDCLLMDMLFILMENLSAF